MTRAGGLGEGGFFGTSKRFEKLERVATSGRAEVWKVRDTAKRPFAADRIVAVKCLKGLANRDDRERLRREGGRRFKHENLIEIFASRGGERAPFVVMEYIPGEDCHHLLAEHVEFSPDRLIEVGRQLCAGLRHLHEAKLVHRDLKPRNVMVIGRLDGEEPIRVKLIDLGIAHAPGDTRHTQTGAVVGTKPYMAPEVEIGGPANELSDVYGVGATLYELATGQQLPLPSSQERITSQRDGRFPAPHQLSPAVPRWLSAVIMRALALSPTERFGSVAAMEAALEAEDEEVTGVLGPHEAPTEVMGATEIQPGSAGHPGGLPGWMRRRGHRPSEGREETELRPLVLLIFAATAVLFIVLLLPFSINVAAAVGELPRFVQLLLAIVVLVLVWLRFDREARRALAQALRSGGKAVGGWRHGAWAALREQTHSAWVALRKWVLEWEEWGPPPQPLPAPPIEDREPFEERAHQGQTPEREPEPDADRRPGWAGKRPSVPPFLRDVRPHLGEVREASRDWAHWLGRRAFVALVAAMAVSFAFWLLPELKDHAATQPRDHRLILTLVPALAWSLVAIAGVLLIWRSRTPARRLVLSAVLLLLLLAALGLLAPSAPAWLEPRFWPKDHSARARASRPALAGLPALTCSAVVARPYACLDGGGQDLGGATE